VNYRHHFHAGNFADVMKHALLVQLARGLQRKLAGFLFVDTHAGRGSYILTKAEKGARLARLPEYPDGIGRLWQRDDLPPPLADYVGLVRKFDRRTKSPATPHFYPGSPCLMQLLARPQDRMVLCERQPAEASLLRKSLLSKERVIVKVGNGYAALSGFLPPLEKRALVLIDPPFEEEKEGEQIVAAVAEAIRRLPTAVCAIWYPLTGRVRAATLLEGLRALPSTPTLVVDIIVEPNAPRMNGCGLAILNPPWQFEEEARSMMRYLSTVLARAPGGSSTVRWLVPAR
jgi:23S rRNA (adenine2030-N6)-methyltransferase